MIFVKLCGITRVEDATAAARYGAAAVGFIFAESPRKISIEKASVIVGEAPRCLLRIGVFVNEKMKVIKEIVKKARIEVVQLHGEESPEFCQEVGLPVIKTIKVKGEQIYPNPQDYLPIVCAFLLDTYDPKSFGGSGRAFRWEMIDRVKEYGKPVIVAGGLNEYNVTELIEKYRPFGVDVSSGVELSPGIKSSKKIKNFLEKVKEAERNTLSI